MPPRNPASNPEVCQFVFYESISLVRLTGLKARSLDELATVLTEVDPEVIFHHTHQYFLKVRPEAPEYPNDFAQWAAESLEDKVLAEKLSNIDPFEFDSLEDLREALLSIMDTHLEEFPYHRTTLPGREFYFNQNFSIVIATGIEAMTLSQFREALPQVDDSSIYFHVLEGKLRLRKRADDFSAWIEDCLGMDELAEKIRTIDPYFSSLEDIRSQILAFIDEFLPSPGKA